MSKQHETQMHAISRRGFLRLVGGVGAGLTLGVYTPMLLAETSGLGQTAETAAGTFEPNAFIRIGSNNVVTVICKHLEMGQGTYTGLATLIAEELDADWSQIRTEGAPANAALYNNLNWGKMQGTGGSSAIANSFQQMRMAGAAGREMLVAAAAARWQVPADEISVSKGVVSHTDAGRSASFGELADDAARQPLPDPKTLKLKDPKDFVYIGKQVTRKDTGKDDGSAIFTQDIRLEGMLVALVAHPPRFGAKLKDFDSGEARKIKGVVDVLRIPNGVAVLANDFWSAKTGRDKLQVSWDEDAAFKQSSPEIMADYRALAETPGTVARNDGDAAKALAQAPQVIEAEYEFPYLAHAAMEPLNCVARVTGNGCEIWNGEQMQTQDQNAVSTLLGIKPEQVKIHMLYAGGSFGRRANPHSDYVLEAVEIARMKPGVPVKMVWTREDDMRAGYYRPAFFHKIRAALDKDGNPVAWDQRIVGQSIAADTVFAAFLVKNGVDATSVEGAATLPYRIPNLHVDLHTVTLPVPVQWWRSVGHTHTAFSTETFIDALARAAGRDPVEFRLALLKDEPRYQGVLKLAAEKADWGAKLPAGHARGVALHKSFNTYVAEVAEISLQENNRFKVERVVCAVDCGIAVNPDIIRAQMEGGIGFGLSPTLVSEITLDKGRVVQSNFNNYQVLRIDQMPRIEVHIVPSAEAPTGVGEPGTPPIAAAVANALTAATGKRFGKLPLSLA
ncbi:MAG: xanthine dehydrogenase family protein molybdopterin-binding subunit [Candidatus Thiodiazotropha sp.]